MPHVPCENDKDRADWNLADEALKAPFFLALGVLQRLFTNFYQVIGALYSSRD